MAGNKIQKLSSQCRNIKEEMQKNATKAKDLKTQNNLCVFSPDVKCGKPQENYELGQRQIELLFDYQANNCQSQFDAKKIYNDEKN